MNRTNFNLRPRRASFRTGPFQDVPDAPNRRQAFRKGASQAGLPERIITASSRENPADKVLREQLKAERDVMPADMRAVAQTVFNYFRWRGWLDLDGPLNLQIRKARELAANFAEKPESFSDASLIERVAPEWARGELAITPAWARAIQGEPRLWLRAKPGQGRSLVEKLGAAKLEKTLLPDLVHYKGEEDLFKRDEFHAGEFEIQDIASQAVGWACAPQPGETWWDACAGEGGKTLHLSALMLNKGLIWSSDRAEWRLKNLKRRAARAQVFNFRAAQWDGGAKLPTKTKFDGVLLDAPCSGVGTWQRNPHARWTTTLQDVTELAAVQKQLLAHAAPSVKPGGKLIYSVCTLTRSETEHVVADFNAKFAGEFEPMTLPQFSESQSLLTSAATMTIWPQDAGGNGMFIAGWQRRKK
ncbi:MAG TPA: RsmB/NOP family class I SAM-dependent RNA methyltransferase [Verrucomicrobiae bacterium]|nr:RsmB/NOP family class I SAM-dependent RNA methyltransferase [Verrucomicrobiae bacterium]